MSHHDGDGDDVPFIFDPIEMAEWFGSAFFDDLPNRAQVWTAFAHVGSNHCPSLVSDLFDMGLLAFDVACSAVPDAWCRAEWPMLALDRETWRNLFRQAGYTANGRGRARPTRTLRLWRGAPTEHRDGFSWTDRRRTAEWFAAREHNGGSGLVWVADVPPERLLARLAGPDHRNESEYVVDTAGLEIAQDQSARLPKNRDLGPAAGA